MNIFETLGLRTVINAAATMTYIGGSVMNPKAAAAMHEASQYFVDLRELQRAVGKKLAVLTRNEDAMVTTGAASGLFLAVAGCLKMADPAGFARLPMDIPRAQRVILYRSQEVEFVCGVQQVGVTVDKIGHIGERERPEAWELEDALHDGALAVLYIVAGPHLPPGAPSFDEVAKVCLAKNVPLIVDAAAQIPPVENLWRFTQRGATVTLFSGGKGLRGPSSTGLMVGKHKLIETCRGIISPNIGLGRMFKLDKEEMIGLLVAVEEYVNSDHAAYERWCEAQVAKVLAGVKDLAKLKAERDFPNEAGQPIARVRLSFDPGVMGRSKEELLDIFLKGEPAILFLPGKGDFFYFNPLTIQEGETELCIRRLREVFA